MTAMGSTQEFSYDAAGNVEQAVDGTGAATRFMNDEWGRAVRVIRADEGVEEYTYDHAGNFIEKRNGNILQ
jgi:YD repeat-containing protein